MTGHVLSWLLCVLALVTPITALVDWLVGDEGVKRNKDRLAAWYVFIQDGDWSRFLSSTASITDEFLDKLLGTRIFSTRAAVIWLIINSCLSLVAFQVNHIIQQFGIEESLIGAIGLFCVDFVALGVSRLLLRKLATSSGTKGIGVFIVTSCALAYLCIGIFMAAGNSVSVGERSMYITGTPESWVASMLRWPVEFVSLIDWTGRDAELGRYSPVGAILMILPAAFSASLFGSVVVAAYGVYLLHSKRRDLLAIFVERVSEQKRGIMTAFTVAATSLTAILTAFVSAQK